MLQRPGAGVAHHLVHVILNLAGEDGDAEGLCVLDVLRNLLEHGEAARDVETADHHLHAELADQPRAAMLLDARRDLARPFAAVGLVHGADVDRNLAPEYLTLGGT